MRRLKGMGFSDKRLAQLALRSAHVERQMSEAAARGGGVVHDALKGLTGGVTEAEVRRARLKLGVRPVFKRIDTCAAEFDAATPYLYSTYEAPLFSEPEDEAEISDRRKKLSSWAAGQTASVRGSSSTIAAATPRSRSRTPALRRS
jgi:carbamoyl-phosphate synthase large subunit